jgi:parallel beta-helix repeat protein
MNKIKLLFSVFLISFLVLASIPQIKVVKAQGNTIYIRADGTVEGTENIQGDGNVYTFTSDVFDSIVVEKDDVVIDGAGYSLQGNGSRFGIDISERSNVIVKNTHVDNFDYGIYVENSLNILVTGNNITNNKYGIDLVSSSRDNSISRNYVANNEVFGIRLYFCVENEILENNIINNNLSGILLYFSENSTLSENSIIANEWGINLYGSGYNNLSGNSITNNKIGLWFFGSSHNKMVSNNITDSQRSMYLEMQAFDNMIYHNNVVNNVQQVFTDIDSVNVWDNGDEGNYWSNYNGTDNDSNEIGDTPYVIDQNNQDNYPLMNIVEIPEFPSWSIISIVFTLTLVILIFKTKLKKKVLE